MRTTIVIGIVLMSLACLPLPAAAETVVTVNAGDDVEELTSCVTVDPTHMPPVYEVHCGV